MVYYGPTSRIRGFDPVKAGDVAPAQAISKIYEGLLQYAYLERPYRVQPLLAESMPDISDDGLTYTFYLRDDALWHNGRPIVADDFKKAFADVDVIAGPTAPSPAFTRSTTSSSRAMSRSMNGSPTVPEVMSPPSCVWTAAAKSVESRPSSVSASPAPTTSAVSIGRK